MRLNLFNVTLDHLLILPHLEVIEEMEENRKMMPDQLADENHDYDNNGSRKTRYESQKRQRKGVKSAKRTTNNLKEIIQSLHSI